MEWVFYDLSKEGAEGGGIFLAIPHLLSRTYRISRVSKTLKLRGKGPRTAFLLRGERYFVHKETVHSLADGGIG